MRRKNYKKPIKPAFSDAERPTSIIEVEFGKLDSDVYRMARIETRCAEYREFQCDDNDIGSDNAFFFADIAANTYLPWAVAIIAKLEKEGVKQASKLWNLQMKLKNKRSPAPRPRRAAGEGEGLSRPDRRKEG